MSKLLCYINCTIITNTVDTEGEDDGLDRLSGFEIDL